MDRRLLALVPVLLLALLLGLGLSGLAELDEDEDEDEVRTRRPSPTVSLSRPPAPPAGQWGPGEGPPGVAVPEAPPRPAAPPRPPERPRGVPGTGADAGATWERSERVVLASLAVFGLVALTTAVLTTVLAATRLRGREPTQGPGRAAE